MIYIDDFNKNSCEMKKGKFRPYGLHGCSCHPFNDWKDCDYHHKKKVVIGDKVENRHTQEKGIVHEIYFDKNPKGKKVNGFVVVNYGNGRKKSDYHLEHIAMLLIKN